MVRFVLVTEGGTGVRRFEKLAVFEVMVEGLVDGYRCCGAKAEVEPDLMPVSRVA